MITAYIVNANGTTEVRNIENNLQTYYDIIGCDAIDIVSRRFAGKYLDVICDDEGLLKDDARLTAIDVNSRPMLVGTLIIVDHDDEGETVSLTAEDVKRVEHCTVQVRELATGDRRKIVRCGY